MEMLRATAGNTLRELDDQETNNAALQGLDTTRGCSREGKTEMGDTDGCSDRFRWPEWVP